MREIKFRAYLPKDYKGLNKGILEYVDQLSIFKDGSVEIFVDGSYIRLPSEFVKLMQYTGLKDKNGNGVEIYEGDIILSEGGSLGEVKWRHFGFEQDMINSSGWWVIQEDGEVIGNIYQNSDLLNI